MRGNSFTALTMNQTATVWEKGLYWGRCGKIVSKSGIGRKGKGWVVVEFSNGETTGPVPFDKVAFGDNSYAKDD